MNEMTGCLLCGAELCYTERAEERRCAVCGQIFMTNAFCKNGHYVCDTCHDAGVSEAIRFLLETDEKDPVKLFARAVQLPSVHMHGPEHHIIIPCVLLTAYKNCGGDIDLPEALEMAVERGSRVPGGICGNWGVCGAAAGAGIYASIVTGSSPLNPTEWPKPIDLASRCTGSISAHGGPRCCKRTSNLAIREAVGWTRDYMGVELPCGDFICTYSDKNRECIREGCPFYAGKV